MLATPAFSSGARCIAAGLFAALGFACGGAAPAPAAPSAVAVRSLTVVLVRAEPGYQAMAVAAFSDGSSREVTRETQWSSSNPAVAAVSETGSVSVLASGTTEIRGTYQSVSGNAQLTVADPPPPPAPAAQRRVTVRVRDALDQAPVSNVKLTLVPAEQSDGPTGWTTNAGEFSFTAAWGPYVTVHARQEGYALKAVQQP